MAVFIITGASRGIGREVAKKLAVTGNTLIINCKSSFEELDILAGKLNEKCRCISIHGEINKEILEKNMPFSLNTMRNIDEKVYLINNAGISEFSLAQDISDESMYRMIDNNIFAMLKTTRATIPYLLKAETAGIINISSVWGMVGASMESMYSLTKGGINAFTKALSKELAPMHIPVNAIAPGAIDTDMNTWMDEEEKEALESEIPYGRMGRCDEVADAVAGLLDMPSYLTGNIIKLDGGWI